MSCALTPAQVTQCTNGGGHIDPAACLCAPTVDAGVPDAGPCDPFTLSLLQALCFGNVDTAACTCGTSGADGGMGTADAGTRDAGGALGDPCTFDLQCMVSSSFLLPNTCVQPDLQGHFTGGYCSASCNSDTDCGAEGSCVQVNTFVSRCYRNCTPGMTGACRPGYACTELVDSSMMVVGHVCDTGCTSSSDCTMGQACNLLTGLCQ